MLPVFLPSVEILDEHELAGARGCFIQHPAFIWRNTHFGAYHAGHSNDRLRPACFGIEKLEVAIAINEVHAIFRGAQNYASTSIRKA